MLKQLFDRFVLGKRTLAEVDNGFPSQIAAVRVILIKWFTAEFERAGMKGEVPNDPDASLPMAYACQVVNYLTGELVDPFNDTVSEGLRDFAVAVSEDVPETADNLMKQDRSLREVVVYTLRMRFILGTLRDRDFAKSNIGQRISLLLTLYGAEFTDEIEERRYATLVNNLAAWSESAAFPGRHIRGKRLRNDRS